MKVYLVGDAVRDKLLGLEPKDLDYVVVGSTPEEMLSLGYKQVGCDFPVFLHPTTGEEYALARTEVKDGLGYQGFNCQFGPDVSLEEDLKRRDLTINAMAEDLETGEIIDPFKGQRHILYHILKEPSDSFKEDPVRVLRVARFASTLPGDNWKVGFDTYMMWLELWQEEQKHVTPERVFKELEKALSGDKPHKFFEWMCHCFKDECWFSEYSDGMAVPQPAEYHPEGDVWQHQQLCLREGVKLGCNSKEQFAIMCHDFGKSPCYSERGNLHGHEEEGVQYVNNFCDRLKVPTDYRDLAVKVCRWHTHSHRAFDMKPNKVIKLLEVFGVKDEESYYKLKSFLNCCEADAKGRGPLFEKKLYPQRQYLLECMTEVLKVNTKKIVASMLEKGKSGPLIGEAVRVAKIDVIRKVKNTWRIEDEL